MDATIERECSALGGLFQQIITDMKVSDIDMSIFNIYFITRPRFFLFIVFLYILLSLHK